VTDRGSPGALWADALEALANHVAHDFRNALNGVAVNLEVVRGSKQMHLNVKLGRQP